MMNSASAGGALHGPSAGTSQAEDWLAELNSQQDRERVIELLLSQERVIALLYEKTFPMTTADPNNLNYLDDEQQQYQDHHQQQQVFDEFEDGGEYQQNNNQRGVMEEDGEEMSGDDDQSQSSPSRSSPQINENNR